ncbi:phage minor head protein, partial [Treponema sp. R6D11]
MTRSTFEAVGIERYKWRTSIDERVRDSHLLMEGKICNVNDRTVVWDKHLNRFVQRDSEMPLLHPGEDFQCRCVMEILDDEVKDVEEELLEEQKVEVKNAVQEFKNMYPGGEEMEIPSTSPTNPKPVS